MTFNNSFHLKWGIKNNSSSKGTIYFESSFSKIYCILTSLYDDDAGAAVTVFIDSISTDFFTFHEYYSAKGQNAGSASEYFYWLAIGQA